MITEREVKILTDAIKKQSGLDIPPDAALTALYAVADYNYRRIPLAGATHRDRCDLPNNTNAIHVRPARSIFSNALNFI